MNSVEQMLKTAAGKGILEAVKGLLAERDEEFAALLDRPIPQSCWDEKIGSNDAISRFGTAKSPVARWLCRYLERRLAKGNKKDLTELFILNMPPRAMAQMTGGRITHAMTEDIAFLANGHLIRGSFRLWFLLSPTRFMQ